MKIPFLSTKNKKLLTTGFFWFGLAVLVVLLVRVYKAGKAAGGEYLAFAKDEIKNLFDFDGPDQIAKSILFLFSVGVALFSFAFDGGSTGIVLAVALGTMTTGAAVVTTFNSTYLPKYFFYTAATQLTGVKITVQGDGVIFDSDAAGLNHCGVNRLFGQITNSYYFRLANGFVSGKNVIWEFTNSAAQTPVIYVDSDETPAPGQELYLQLLRQAVLANSGQNFVDFATLSLPSLAAGDVVNVLFNDGTQQQLNRSDIQALLQLTQNVVNTPIYTIDNFAQRVKMVNVIAGSAQTAYVQRWVPAVSGGMINQSVNF